MLNADSNAFDRWVHEQVTTKQQRNCHTAHGLPKQCCAKGPCQYGFPFDTHPEHHPSEDPLTQRWLYHRATVSDSMTSPYHAICLGLWGAHMNLQRVTGTDWSFYLLKYTLKAECTGPFDLDTHTLKRMGLGHLPTAEQHLLNSLAMGRPVSAAEAYCIAMQTSIVRFPPGRSVNKINSSPPGSRTYAKYARNTLMHPVTTYLQRPAELESLTFCKFYSQYAVEPMKHNATKEQTFICQIGDKCVYEQEGLLVQFTAFHPVHNTEGWCYNQLLSRFPFSHEDDMLSSQDGPQSQCSYYHECIARGIFNDEESLQECIRSYTDHHLWCGDVTLQLANKVMQAHSFQLPMCMEGDDSEATADIMQCVANRVSVLQTEFAHTEDAVLNTEQQIAVDAITGDPVGMHVNSGSPGTRKFHYSGIDSSAAQTESCCSPGCIDSCSCHQSQSSCQHSPCVLWLASKRLPLTTHSCIRGIYSPADLYHDHHRRIQHGHITLATLVPDSDGTCPASQYQPCVGKHRLHSGRGPLSTATCLRASEAQA